MTDALGEALMRLVKTAVSSSRIQANELLIDASALDEFRVAFHRDRQQLDLNLREVEHQAWVAAIEESYVCGWMSDYARDEMLARNPYRSIHSVRRPWGDAKAGEVWDVDLEKGGIRAVTVHGSSHRDPVVVFRDVYKGDEYDFTDTAIRDARRVWPEGA